MTKQVPNPPQDASRHTGACPPQSLLTSWLDGDAAETSLDPALTDHLAHCAFCQRRLSETAATEPWWQAAAECLAGPEPEETLATLAIPAVAAQAAGDADAVPLTTDFAEQLPDGLLEPPSHPELLGRLGRYEIERLIGQGGMGLVFRAFDPQLHRVVAIKLLAPQLAASATARERFAREARAVAALAHPHLVAIHDVVADGPLPYLVMTYIDGTSLEELVRRHGPLPIDQVVQLARQLSAALATAHEAGLIHRDIKPGNILCEADGQRAVLTDFGLVRTLDDATLTHSGILAGTPHYMAPEQARGDTVGPEADLWGVGAVLYFALTGRPPFEAEHPMAVLHQVCSARPERMDRVRPKIPAALAAIVERLLEKKPADRYRDCVSLKIDLDRLARGSVSRWYISHRWRVRRRLRRAAAISAAAALLLVTTWALLGRPIASRDANRPAAADKVSPDAMSRADLVALQVADTQWRQQLSELYASVSSAAAEAAPRVDPLWSSSDPAQQLLAQLAQTEQAAAEALPGPLDPQASFESTIQATLEHLERLTPVTPFASP